MFQAQLAFDDFDSPLDPVDGGFSLGGSRIVPVAHRLLQTTVHTLAGRIVIVSHERFADEPPGLRIDPPGRSSEDSLAALDRHPFDFAVLTIDRAARTVAYRASPLASVPAYLIAGRDAVTIDWDYARLLGDRDTRIVWDIALGQIAGLSTYGTATIVEGVHRTAAGAVLTASPRGVAPTLPAPIRHDGAQELSPGIDAEARLFDTLAALLAARPLDPTRTAVELSGGMDSALTAMAAARALGPGLMSVGAQFGGAMGDAQRDRRLAVAQRAGLDDLSIPAERYAPFAPGSWRRRRYGVWPEDENYPEMFEAIFAMLRSAGIDALVSGFGGDELYLAYAGEDGVRAEAPAASVPFLTPRGLAIARAAHAPYPRGWLQESCWQSAAGQLQRLLRYGMWPIYPYHNVELARFVSRLPRPYRRNRRLLRDTLARVLGAPIFSAGYVKETFDPVALRGMTENRDYLIELVRRSPMARHPEIDDQAILAALRSDIAALDRETFQSLFRVLKIFSFFQ